MSKETRNHKVIIKEEKNYQFNNKEKNNLIIKMK